MPETTSDVTTELPSAQVLHYFRRIWDALVVGPDSDSSLLQLPVLQLRCLRRIAADDGQRMVDIAHKMQMPLPGASRLVDRLVRRGMVARRSDPHDRRVVRIELTPAGRTGLAEIERKRQVKIESCLRHLDPRTVSQLVESLELLSSVTEQAHSRDSTL
ncbi:MAG TPA: MarR family winged helix-turn-helix transcriptional regulator [Capsulimonadaceae bacterium]|nr:MarR family winged helix-turn-helix transcriptional regulator [Capsulimonadaceae bacterium]